MTYISAIYDCLCVCVEPNERSESVVDWQYATASYPTQREAKLIITNHLYSFYLVIVHYKHCAWFI